MRWPTLILAALLLLVQGDLWLGKGNMPYVMSLQKQLDLQQVANAQARERNARAAAEVAEKARAELGMIKPDEILVHVSPLK